MSEAAVVVVEIARRAKAAAAELATLCTAAKDAALIAAADALVARSAEILAANSKDVDQARAEGMHESLVDRLALSPARVEAMADGLREVAALADPVGEILSGWTRPNGLEIRKIRVPLGVVGIIYEARPNVTADAAGLCLKAGNACVLRGSGSALASNQAIVAVMSEALAAAGIPEGAVGLVPFADRESAKVLMSLREYVDALIPRGGAGLIRTVVENSTIPVIETGVGNCHVYVDAKADLAKALPILVNAKVQRPGVCNAAETLLVHSDIAEAFLPEAIKALQDKGCVLYGDERTRTLGEGILPAGDEEYREEFLDLKMAVRVVDSLEQAIEHIATYSSHHTEAIVTEDYSAARRFAAAVDSAVVMVNASTRFTDGGEFGFGAEIGISTQKLHARGPMGLPELTTYKFVVFGEGQIRS
ncbi:MAG: glutamate-5-semialdehyde dehydrogenase [Actinomycetota bacterium]